ncbi:MAG: PAS domain-containing sensor histidine kinase [Bdellovibrionales bacterium]|nr:PAS domain-containing sensor histidine kinase [Bdellovibrionales bacterium]
MVENTKVQALAQSRILWAEESSGDESSGIFQQISRHIQPAQLVRVKGFDESLLRLSESDISLAIAIGAKDSKSAVDFLASAKELRPDVPRLLLLEEESGEVLIEAVNRAGVFGVFPFGGSEVELSAQIYEAIRIKEKQEDRSSLVRRIKGQNRDLEELTSGQAELVKERTRELQVSKSEAEGKVTEISRLILFVKNLAGLVAVEELVELLREETKPFHQVRDPILGYVLSNHNRRLLHIRSGKVHMSQAKAAWPQGLRLRLNEKEDSQYLANAFSRPFGRVLAIPLPSGKKPLLDDKFEVAVLFFEHSLTGRTQENFLTFLSTRLQPLSIALDRILLEQELRNTSHLWEQSFDGIDEPIAIVDMDFNLLLSNRSFTNRTGGPPKCYWQFQDRGEICAGCPVSAALEGPGPQQSLVKKGSQIFEVHSYPIRLYDEDHPTTVVNHYLDVTRAHELQSRMVQNEKMAAVGHLAGHIAHELNNPLTGIRSTAQILLHDRTPGNSLYSDLVEVEKAAARCQSIIRNLLEFSRGSHEMPLKVVPFNEIVSKTLPLLKTAMNPFIKEIELSEEDTRVKVEPQLLQQVVFNIVNNACQAMDEGGTLWISTETGMEEGKPYVDFRVRDSGNGIPEEIQESIFDPFFTTKAEGKGTGLGLSMSRKVVEEFGGRIWVWSEGGSGTEFTVRLPSAVEDQ